MASAGRSADIFWQSGGESGICKTIGSMSASGSGDIASGCEEQKSFSALIRPECHAPACCCKLLIWKN
jgi:hypothetical protein